MSSITEQVTGPLDVRAEREEQRASAAAQGPAFAKRPITLVQSWPAEVDKPLATGSGISCLIQLAEPHVYVYGLKPESREQATEGPGAIIRGKLILKVEKSAKIKAVTLRFYGQQRTEWPEGKSH